LAVLASDASFSARSLSTCSSCADIAADAAAVDAFTDSSALHRAPERAKSAV